MKKKVSKHKLNVKVEKVRDLDEKALEGSAGGALYYVYYTTLCTQNCATGDCCAYSIQK